MSVMASQSDRHDNRGDRQNNRGDNRDDRQDHKRYRTLPYKKPNLVVVTPRKRVYHNVTVYRPYGHAYFGYMTTTIMMLGNGSLSLISLLSY